MAFYDGTLSSEREQRPQQSRPSQLEPISENRVQFSSSSATPGRGLVSPCALRRVDVHPLGDTRGLAIAARVFITVASPRLYYM